MKEEKNWPFRMPTVLSLLTALLLVFAASCGGGGGREGDTRVDHAGVPATDGDLVEESVFALLYEDGTMVFQYGNTPEDGRTIAAVYPVNLTSEYPHQGGDSPGVEPVPETPWYEKRDVITRVDFADKIAPIYMSCWFMGLENLTEITNFDNLDISNVISMRTAFYGCKNLKALDVSRWDTSGVESLHGLFTSCSSLTELDVSGWNVSDAKDISGLFTGTSVTALDVSGWDTSHAEDIHGMFANCSGLTELDVSEWNTANVTRFNGLFMGCTGLTELDLSGWDTSSGNLFAFMFKGCTNLKTIWGPERFLAADDMMKNGDREIFADCSALVGGNGTKYDKNHTDLTYARIDTAGAPGYFTRMERSG